MPNASNLPTPKPTDVFRPLTPAEVRQRRGRSIALAVVLGALVLLFYAVTIAKLGANAISSNI
jgi:hypothetical protein